MIDQSSPVAVRASVTVEATQDRAFTVFTEGMSGWWPLETHHVGTATADAAVVEPRTGGRWYERGTDGSECDWGRVLAYEPPDRLVLSWQIDSGWQFDAGLVTEVEVRFFAEGPERTRVEVEHRHLEWFGAATEEMRATFESPGGWPGLVARFADAVRQ